MIKKKPLGFFFYFHTANSTKKPMTMHRFRSEENLCYLVNIIPKFTLPAITPPAIKSKVI